MCWRYKIESKFCFLSPSKYNSWFRKDLYGSWSNILLLLHLMFVAVTVSIFGLLIPRHLASWWILVLKVKLLQFTLAGTMILWTNWYECHELQKIFNLGRQNIFNLYKRNLKESQKLHSVILFISLIFDVHLY